jgi:hypothetical protein
MRKSVPAFLATLALAVLPLRAQNPPEQHTFTLNWQTNTSLNTTYNVHSLTAFDGQAPPSSVCGSGPDGSNVWCGEVHHYASGLYDSNFPTMMLSGCNITGTSGHTVYTAVDRRTVTETDSFFCTGWSVTTTITTYQYRSAQRYFYYWYNFPQGQQPAINGTLGQV